MERAQRDNLLYLKRVAWNGLSTIHCCYYDLCDYRDYRDDDYHYCHYHEYCHDQYYTYDY